MSDLDEYRQKRRFGATPEPRGAQNGRANGARVFVIQQHAATRMHFDLRLEIAGVLKSWAVPEGPTLDPKVRKLAIRTEDHPLDYKEFEGIIPEGQYGAGKMIVWDRGEWAPIDDPEVAVAKGELKFRLYGDKVRGGFMLKRLKAESNEWLLIKERDNESRPEDEYCLVRDAPESIVSGLTVENLSDAEPVLHKHRMFVGRLKGAEKLAQDDKPKPMLPTLVQTPPQGEEWLHEIKYDGYRISCVIRNGDVRIITRNGHDWTQKFAALVEAIAELNLPPCTLDGEAVVQDLAGKSDFGLLQKALSENNDHLITFFAFDIRNYKNYNVEACSFTDRRALLDWALTDAVTPASAIQLSEITDVSGAALFARACDLGLEGIVSKDANSTYIGGRSKNWLKTKRADIGVFTVLGYAKKDGRIASLILAREISGDFEYVGKAGSGLSAQLIKRIAAAPSGPALTSVKSLPAIFGAVFLKPVLEAKVAHRGVTKAGVLRQPAVLDVTPKTTIERGPSLVSDQDLASIQITNPERKLFGGETTKLDLAVYYARVGDLMLPHILERPISFVRNPTGKLEDSFFQRHAFEGLPEGIDRVNVPGKDKETYLVIREPRAYLSLAQYGVVEFHPWPCLADQLDRPDRLIIDLDPDETLSLETVAMAAQFVGDRFRELELTPFLRSTGGKGLHVVVPLERRYSWKTFGDFAFAFVKWLTAQALHQFTTSPSKKDRAGKIYLDYLRNRKGSTAIASYSARARADLPVSLNLAWADLSALGKRKQATILDILHHRLDLGPDPWADIDDHAAVISKAARRAVGIKER